MTDLWPGRPFPLGATWDGSGTNFSLFSEHAERVELCLFDGEDEEERVELSERTAHTWHCYLPGIGPGQCYGFRVHGPYDPEHGHRFNPAKLLLDPYAKSIDGPVRWDAANVLPYVPTDRDDADLEPDDEDDVDAVPKSVVIDPRFDWEGDRRPNTQLHESVIYEAHVKGFTQLHPDVREDLRGTYAGLASEPSLAYLRELGVTAVELLPVHHIVDESFLFERGLTNYWGYSTIGFFAPHSEYAATGQRGQEVREFKGMVKALHRAGIEVILDVVYNHTGEGNHLGPMLSFKGVDNTSYYRLVPDDPRHYMDYTGTGNTLNAQHPSVLRLIMDSLRYWVTECHVDGFRFDLASALARELYDVDRLSAFFDVIHQDPVLSQVKLIAEPWDVGPGGYQVGNFPVLWSEWNGIYRDVMRDFWRGQASVGEFASRLTGSSDLYEHDGRHPFASINFLTAHDGFTLRDLVSYNDKHNEANLEGNRDGTDDNRSWNCGVEGETDDPEINELRARQQRNFLATLILSQGTPMLLGGDEFGRTQHGSNNAWCQDNEISWFDWSLLEENRELHEFVRKLIVLRRAHPVFRRRQFLRGTDEDGTGLPDVWWFRTDGHRMTKSDWESGERTVGMFLNGEEIASPDEKGQRVLDESFLLLFNAHHEDVTFTLPNRRFGERWALVLSTTDPGAAAELGRGRRARGHRRGWALTGPAAAPMTELRATYRLQLGGGFGFAAARELVPYLADLGVSHLYLPPSFQARPGSMHGYDVVDPTSISEELGGEAEFRALVAAAREAGLGVILDIVPNHMAVDDANRYWTEQREKFFDVDPETGGYRRFFDIDHLAGVRQEDPEVFAETHRLALALVREGAVDGLRIDHPDGLADPAGYLERLRAEGVEHVWVEKILDPGESLRPWPVEGTVGYEFLNDVAALFVDPAGEERLTALWHEVSGDARPFRAYADEAKLEQATTTFAAEVDRLRRLVPRDDLPEALASLPVYRTYIRDGHASPEDREVLREAGIEWLLDAPAEFVTRFQQTTPPVMAKGVEDTAFYRYLRLLALNDVGGDPGRFGLSVADFHAANAERPPRNLLVTQTHDTKRSGDVRARIGALSGMAEQWEAHVRGWLALTSAVPGPDAAERYLVFQTLVGAWPIEPERLDGYLEKALREAKRTTNWIEPDEEHEAAVKAFARGLSDLPEFREDFDPFVAEVAAAGERAALGQLLLKLTVPGVPDIYNGDELPLLSLVDPDNRRAVDWEARREALAALRRGEDVDPKLLLIVRALALRARRSAAFSGAYTPVDAGEDVVAFARGDGEVLVVVPVRSPHGATLELPAELAGAWQDVLTGALRDVSRRTPVTELTSAHGLALLERV